MMKSIDGGRTFTRVATPHGDNHDLWINPRNPKWMINANDGGANVSLDGGKTWSTQNNQPTAQFYRVNTDKRFPFWIYGGQQDNTTVAIKSDRASAMGPPKTTLCFSEIVINDVPRRGLLCQWELHARRRRDVLVTLVVDDLQLP